MIESINQFNQTYQWLASVYSDNKTIRWKAICRW